MPEEVSACPSIYTVAMKSLILLVVLSTALFVALDAAPVLPSHFEAELEAVARQQSDNSEMFKTFLNIFTKILTSAGDKSNGGDSSIQGDNELGRTLLNVASGLLSTVGKKADPNDEFQQSLLNGVGSRVDTLPTYTGNRFDQSILEAIDENAAMMEGDEVDLSEEAKTQLWGAILGSLASSLLNKYLGG